MNSTLGRTAIPKVVTNVGTTIRYIGQNSTKNHSKLTIRTDSPRFEPSLSHQLKVEKTPEKWGFFVKVGVVTLWERR